MSSLSHSNGAAALAVVALAISGDCIEVALGRRRDAPLRGRWQLPGVDEIGSEGLTQCASGVLRSELGLNPNGTDPAFSARDAARRDARGVRITVSSVVLTGPERLSSPAVWTPTDVALGSSRLAFDHASVLEQALSALARDLQYTDAAVRLCPAAFSMAQLRHVYEVVWGLRLDPANFHRKIVSMDDLVVSTGDVTSIGPGRPAALFRAGEAHELSAALRRPRA